MKRFLSYLIVLCMVMAMCPVISLADANTYTAVRTAYFNNAAEWKLSDSSTGNDNILVASGGNEGWQGEGSFTDLNGTTAAQAALAGTGFNSPRNALVSFAIPEGFDPDSTLKVTLSLTVKNVKQVTSGVRLAVYGNSVDGTWSESDNKGIFGAEGTASGLDGLECLGLTTPIATGNQSGETASGETITLSSMALTEYVCNEAKEGKSEVTFRIATPLGGIRLYSYNTNNAPTLTIEKGEVGSVCVKKEFYDGEELVDSESLSINHAELNSNFVYDDSDLPVVEKNGEVYVYSKDRSSLEAVVAADGNSEVTVAYEKFDEELHAFDGHIIDEEGAWCWFADPRSISYKNEDGTIDVTIIGYIDVHGNIKATQINNLTNKVDEVLIRSYIQPDDHNNPTFLVLPDERIVVFYSRHTDEACFWYRVTEEKGDLTTLGEEKCLKTNNNTTYPSPFLLSDDPDNIYLCWRGIGWHPTIAKISMPDENGDMHFTYGPYQMVQSTGARPYAKYASNGKDKIYVSYTTGHPDNEDPNWLYFNQINISSMTLEDIHGNKLSTIANGPFNVNKNDSNKTAAYVVDTTGGVRNWLWQVAVADDGYPVIANVRINGSKDSHDYYYVKWDGTKWVKTFLTNAGGKFHPSNTEKCYSGGMSIDSDNPNVMYCSKPAEGMFGKIFEIFKYTMSDDGTEIVSVEQITKNSRKNNVRPFVIPGSEGKELRVLWMNGDYDYWMVNKSYPAGYPTMAMSEVPLPTEKIDLSDAESNKDYEDIGGAFVSTKSTANMVAEADWAGNWEFTVSADVYVKPGTEGKVLDLGNTELWIKKVNTQYAPNDVTALPRVVVRVDDKEYVTHNVYGTSDNWKYYSTGTKSDYHFTDYDRYVNLTLVYDGDYLTVYRDGLIDLKIKADIDKVNDVLVGGFEGYVENAALFARVLNHDEIAALADNDYVVADPGVEGEDYMTVYYKTYAGLNTWPVDGVDIIEPQKVSIHPGTDYYEFVAEETIFADGATYMLEYSMNSEFDMTAYAVYSKYTPVGDNIITNGSFEDEEGNFSLEGWNSAETNAQFGNPYDTNHCYAVSSTSLVHDHGTVIKASNEIPDGKWAFGSKWNDGTNGLCSLKRYVPVEAGKTYYISYKVRHNTGADGTYLYTTFVGDSSVNDTGGNNVGYVGTQWQTVEMAYTATEDSDHVLFWFRWLGDANNSGNGPFWMFDDFKIYELEKEPIAVNVEAIAPSQVRVHIENVSGKDIEKLKVYAVSYNGDGNVKNAATDEVSITSEEYSKDLIFKLEGDVRIFIWDENMRPVYHTLTEKVEGAVYDSAAPVMVVTKVAGTSYQGADTYKITGIYAGTTETVYLNPDECEGFDVAKGNVIIYSVENGYATNVRVLFASDEEAIAPNVAEGFDDILSNEYSDEKVTIHTGWVTGNTIKSFVISDSIEDISSGDGKKFFFSDEVNYAIVDYNAASTSFKVGKKTDVKASLVNPVFVFIKTCDYMTDEVTDIVIFKGVE